MFGPWGARQISDLKPNSQSFKARTTDYDRRASFPIAVVDDKEFPYEGNLIANNFTRLSLCRRYDSPRQLRRDMQGNAVSSAISIGKATG